MQINLSYLQIKSLIEEAEKILVYVSRDASADGVLAGLTLHTYLAGLGKKPALVYPAEIPSEIKDLSGVQAIEKSLGAKNLVISFDYTKTEVEKVNYKVDKGKFNLILQSKKPIAPSELSFSYTGRDFDLIIFLGVTDLEKLNESFEGEDFYLSKPSLNIDNKVTNSFFAKVNLVDPKASSISEILATLFEKFGRPLAKKEAELLVLGLKYATNNFTIATS